MFVLKERPILSGWRLVCFDFKDFFLLLMLYDDDNLRVSCDFFWLLSIFAFFYFISMVLSYDLISFWTLRGHSHYSLFGLTDQQLLVHFCCLWIYYVNSKSLPNYEFFTLVHFLVGEQYIFCLAMWSLLPYKSNRLNVVICK